MPTKVVNIRRRDMVLSLPYLTTNRLKAHNRFCNNCNQEIEENALKLGVVLYNGLVVYCSGCVISGLQKHQQELVELMTAIKGLDETMTFGGRKNYFYHRDYKDKVAHGIALTAEVMRSFDQLYPPESLNKKDFSCSVCKKVSPIYETRKDGRRKGRKYVPLMVTYTYHNYLSVNSVQYCKSCAIKYLESVKQEYDELLQIVPSMEGLKRKLVLRYDTVGTVFNEDGLSISNVEGIQSCSKCHVRIERTCINLNDVDSTMYGYLCVSCGETYLTDRISAFTRALDTVRSLREDRCRTCPLETQIKCISRGVPVPLESLECVE